MIENSNFNGAKHKLKYDIKDKVEKWLIDDYQIETPLQLSKSEVINLIDEMIDRLN